jgi:hypothetical protein
VNPHTILLALSVVGLIAGLATAFAEMKRAGEKSPWMRRFRALEREFEQHPMNFKPVRTYADLQSLNQDDVMDGYLSAERGDTEPGENRGR